MVNKLRWCLKQKNGLRLIEPNDNLADEYIKNSEETLLIIRRIGNQSNIWLATTKYYCKYFAIYALLMKIGIKSEIHECTIKITEILEEKEILPQGTAAMLERDKELRIDNQYYLKNRIIRINFNKLRDFILTMKDIVQSLSYTKIKDIRDILN